MFRNLRVPALEKLSMRVYYHGQQPNYTDFQSLPQSISSIDLQVAWNRRTFNFLHLQLFRFYTPNKNTQDRLPQACINVSTPCTSYHDGS